MNVIKLGGSLLDDAQRRAVVLRDIATQWKGGVEIVIVHGGGKHIDSALSRFGIAKRTHAGLRITDEATLAVVIDVLDHVVNPMLVAELRALGVDAEGLSGSSTLIAEQHPPIGGVDLGNVGRVVDVNPAPAVALLDHRALPVISCIAGSARFRAAGRRASSAPLWNVNADSAAAAVAVALGAQSLQFITDVPGVLDARGKVVPSLNPQTTEKWIDLVHGGMKPKLQAALHALRGGVARIAIGENGGTELVAA